MSDFDNEREMEILRGEAESVRRESARRTRRSFLVGGAAAAAGYVAWRMVDNSPQVGRLQADLRKALNFNADVNRGVFREQGLSPTFSRDRARPLRLNGTIGMDQALVAESWRLQMVGVAGAEASPRHVQDVTAWNYQYKEDSGPKEQSPPDQKSAPGGDAKGGAAKAAPPKDAGAAGAPGAAGRGNDGLEKGGKAGVNQGSTELKGKVPTVNGLPHVDIAERFNEMARKTSGKRYQGDEEAGPSASSLNIGTPGLLLTMDDLMKLPRVELITEFKCIEGWSEITEWAGVRLRDLIEAYPPEKVNGREPRFVYMETPDGNYYCGYDMAAARHPQSTLVTEMSGQPLTPDHGAPLRLHMPIKYGYKQLKRIGVIAYMDTKPDDYWEKLGYDWYAGL